MFYNIYLELCKGRNLRPNTVAKKLGFSSGSVSNWKINGYTPRSDTLQKIADYFGVSTDYLLGKEQQRKTMAELIAASNEIDDIQAKDEGELLSVYRRLDARGKTLVKAKAYEEYGRIEKTHKPFSL